MASKRAWSAVTLFAAAACAAAPASAAPKGEIRVITDRTESNLAPIFAAFTKATGIAVKAVYLDQGLIARLQSRPREADVVITKHADLLELAKQKKLLQPFSSEKIVKAVPAGFRDADGVYFSDSYRARVIYYSKDRVKPAQLSTYEDLGSPKWKGRVCIRSGYHDYNLSLFGQMMEAMGAERTRAFVKKLAANLARPPTGSDRDQARAIMEKKCDVAIANSYYLGIMLSSKDQRPWGEATRVFFPSQSEGGTFILRSGLALTTAKTSVPAARTLLEFMVRPAGQDYIAQLPVAYPVAGKAPLPELTRRLGEGQPGIKNGAFKIRSVPVDAIARRREAVIRLLDEVGFDKPR